MTMKKGRKLFYIIFSAVVSIALWVYVVYVENPMLEEPIPISNIQIEFENEDLLRDNDLIVSNISAKELTVYFSGRLRDSTRISKLKVRAVVDLADVLRSSTPTGTHALDYELIYEDSGTDKLTVESVSVSEVEVTVEHLTTQEIPVRAVFSGSIAENYMAGALTISQDTVNVAGTEAAIARIAGAAATLKGDALSETVTREVGVTLLDENGAAIDPEEAGLTFVGGAGTVFITQNVLMVKEIALVIDTVETPSVNDSNISISIDPAVIRLSGDPEVLEWLNVINLGTVDLKSFTTSYEETYAIKIPNDTNNLSGVTSATVTITIKDPNIEIRRLPSVNLSYRGAGEGDSVEIINETVSVVIRGKAEEIALVMEENIRVVADLTDYAGLRGTFEVPARVFVDGFPNVDAVGEYKVNVFIS